MEVPKIEKLDELLDNYLGQDRIIVDHETSRLTATGENYGSQMLALDIRIKNKTETEVLHVVAKIPPPGEFIKRMFNIPVTFRNETDFYSVVVPELEDFLHERNLDGYLDCFPEFFGARISLDPAKGTVDDDAVLLLENLKVKGYEMIDRSIGFDLATSKVLIKALARYHAAPLGLKILKPDVFKTKMRTLFQPYKVFDFDDAMFEQIIEKNRKILQQVEGCAQYEQRLVDALKSIRNLPKNAPEVIREQFATIIHTDAWVNNFMVLYKDNVPVNCKIVDFQLGEYGSPARDVIFFIFSSIQIPFIREHYDELIELYYQTLVDGLTTFGCEPPFSRTEFDEEIERVVKEFEFFHCIIMLEPIYATKESLKELDEYTEEDMTVVRAVPPKYKERMAFIIEEFVKRGWI